MNAIYYDTPDRILFRNGLSLRSADGRRYTQTVKRVPIDGIRLPAASGRARQRARCPSCRICRFPNRRPVNALAAEQLGAIFVTKVRRRTIRLDLPGGVVEIAFDDGMIEAGERQERLTEIELELKAGDPSILHDLGLQLLEVAPLRVSMLSKSDRGYSLAFDVAPKASKATPPGIAAAHTVDDVITLLLSSCQHQLLANQAVADCGRDPEGVHQMRVALRRLRTACVLLGREIGSPSLLGFADEARWLAKMLGGAREWDVLVTDTLRRPKQAIGPAIDFDSLRHAAEPHRLAAYDLVRETLAGTRYNRFNLSLRRWIECRGWRNEMTGTSLAALVEPVPFLSARILTQLHRKAISAGRRVSPTGPRRPPSASYRAQKTPIWNRILPRPLCGEYRHEELHCLARKTPGCPRACQRCRNDPTLPVRACKRYRFAGGASNHWRARWLAGARRH